MLERLETAGKRVPEATDWEAKRKEEENGAKRRAVPRIDPDIQRSVLRGRRK